MSHLNAYSAVGFLDTDPKNTGTDEAPSASFRFSQEVESSAKNVPKIIMTIAVVATGRAATFALQYLKKGSQISISGSLAQKDEEGRAEFYLKVYNIDTLFGKGSDSPVPEPPSTPAEPAHLTMPPRPQNALGRTGPMPQPKPVLRHPKQQISLTEDEEEFEV